MSDWPASLPPFLWGIATSSHQVEGGNHNDWTQWEAQGRVARGELSGEATRHWQQYPQDYRHFAQIGINAYRFSLEWSRIEPRPGEFDSAAIATYRRMMEAMRSLGWTPVVTLHHFTLPLWLADRGGIFASDSEACFVRYGERVMAELGDLADIYVTINEPMVLAVMGYATGAWPPGKRSIRRGMLAGNRLARLHRALYRQIKTVKASALVGIAHHFIAFSAETDRPWDRWDRNLADYLFHWRFLRQIGPDQDFIGVNYYSRQWIRCRRGLTPKPARAGAPVSDMGWEIYPEGLEEWLLRLAAWGKPLIVSENGIAIGDDRIRSQFIEDHVQALVRAQNRGAPVHGYFYWSGLDNFEWAEGFLPRFGLIGVDYDTQARRPRESAQDYGRIIRSYGSAYPLSAATTPSPTVFDS